MQISVIYPLDDLPVGKMVLHTGACRSALGFRKLGRKGRVEDKWCLSGIKSSALGARVPPSCALLAILLAGNATTILTWPRAKALIPDYSISKVYTNVTSVRNNRRQAMLGWESSGPAGVVILADISNRFL